MRLDPVAVLDACLGAVGHGVLGDRPPGDGAWTSVPVVYLVEGASIVIPIDAVKPKSGRRLQRSANLDGGRPGRLLVEHYEDDWSQLWWVRVHGRAREAVPTPGSSWRSGAPSPPTAPRARSRAWSCWRATPSRAGRRRP